MSVAEGAEVFSDRYDVVRRLGAGGMGVVYQVRDRKRDTDVALKTLQRLDAGAIYRFKNEFRALADVVHPNLATLYELVAERGRLYFTMELVDGVDFLNYVRADADPALAQTAAVTSVDGRGGRSSGSIASDPTLENARSPTSRASIEPPPPMVIPPQQSGERPVAVASLDEASIARLRSALRQLVRGISALHGAGKLHRDIKPSNVLVSAEGRVVLLDFGLVTDLERRDVTAEQLVSGTAEYMAPEQASGSTLSEASDWYSVGVILYEVLVGALPYRGGRLKIMMDKQTHDPPHPSELSPRAPQDLGDLCMELLRREPERRPKSHELLRRLGAEDETTLIPTSRPSSAHSMTSPFLGREQHVAALHEAFGAVRRDHAVSVYVHGASGMGKTLLVKRFLEEVSRSQNAVVLTGRCYERESVPFKAVDSIVDALSRHLTNLTRADAAALLPREILALTRIFPVLRRVEAIADAPRRAFEVPDPQEVRSRAFAALRELLSRIADRRPLVLWIDDLQWGDADSAALLVDLLRPPEPPALLLIGSYRDEDAARSASLSTLLAARRLGDDDRELEVKPLTIGEARDLALRLMGGNARALEAQASTIAEESGGIPFFVDELVRSLQSGSALRRPSTGRVIRLEDVIGERVDALPDDAQRLLEILAVAGQPIERDVAIKAAEVSAADERSLIALLRTGHMVRTASGDFEALEAYHDRIRETVVARLTPQELVACHKRLAITLEGSRNVDAEALATHFRGAGEPTRAGEFAERAATEAAHALAFDRAARLHRMVLELKPMDDGERRATYEKLADVLSAAGRGSEAAEAYIEAAKGGTAAGTLDVRRRAAEQLLRSGHIDEGLSVVRDVLAALGMKLPATPARALLAILIRTAQIWLRGYGYDERDATQIAPEILARIDVSWALSLGLSTVDTVRGMAFQKQMVLLSLRAGEPFRIARALSAEILASATSGGRAVKATASIVARAQAIVDKSNHPYPGGLMAMSFGGAAHLEQRYADSARLSEQAERTLRDRCTGVAWELANAQLFGLWSQWQLGQVRDLARRVPHLLKEAHERGDLYLHTNLRLGSLSSIWLLQGDVDGARSDANEAIARWSHDRGVLIQHHLALIALVNADLYEGRGEEAGERVQARWRSLDRAFLFRVQHVRLEALHYRARCALSAATASADPHAHHQAALRDAKRMEAERMPASDAAAWLIRAGVAAATGDDDGARRQLERAIPKYESSSMFLWAAAARRRLGALLGGDRGRDAIEEADAFMRAQSIFAPERWTEMLAPGFSRVRGARLLACGTFAEERDLHSPAANSGPLLPGG